MRAPVLPNGCNCSDFRGSADYSGLLWRGQPSTEFPLQTVSVPSNVNSYEWMCWNCWLPVRNNRVGTAIIRYVVGTPNEPVPIVKTLNNIRRYGRCLRCNLREQATQEGAISQSPAGISHGRRLRHGPFRNRCHHELPWHRPTWCSRHRPNCGSCWVYASLTSNTNAPRCQAFHRRRRLNS